MAYAADRRRGLTTLDITDSEPEEYKRRIREAQEMESGPVRVGVDPSAFEWIQPGKLVRRDRPPGITLTTQGIALTPAADELLGRPSHVELGIAPRALAIRASDAASARGYVVTRKRDGGRTYGGGAIMSRAVLRLLVERGWPTRQMIPARWDPEHRMLVAVLPRREGGA